MEQLNVTQAARQLSDLLNRVAYQGASFELTRGGRSIARLVPAGPPKRVKVFVDANGIGGVDKNRLPQNLSGLFWCRSLG